MMISELKSKLKMDIRPTSSGIEYFEAVIKKEDLELVNSILTKHLGPAAKIPGKKADLPHDVQKLVDSMGGLRTEQSFYYSQSGGKIRYCALWPWQSNPDKITLKAGVV
jgi:hypothetical protein